MPALDFLNQRLSVSSRQLGEPAPSPQQLDQLLTAAMRVPDHGRLTPFRLLLVRGEARHRLGAKLAQVHQAADPEVAESALDKDRARFSFAPLIVVVIASVDEHHAKVPVQEQVLAAGCVAYNLLLGAQALGYGAQWLTGWAAYDAGAGAVFGLTSNERVVGFVHIGTVLKAPSDGPRPTPAERVTELAI